jgi:serine/threonine-protein kinase HipA
MFSSETATCYRPFSTYRVTTLGSNLNKSKSFEDVVPESFDRLGARTGFGVAEARQRAREAAERVIAHWHVLSDYLDADSYRRLSARRDKLTLRG